MSDVFSFLEQCARPAGVVCQPTARTNDLFQQLALVNSPTADLTNRGRKAGKEALSHGAPDGPEFQRIDALPRRDWRTAYDVPQLVEDYTREFRSDGQYIPVDCSLLPMQAVALHELRLYGRLYVVAGLGTGKTLLSGLAPTLLGCTYRDTVFIPPSKLVDKTHDELHALALKGWSVVAPKHVISAEEFSRPTNATVLFDIAPRCIVLDESHTFGNEGSGRSKRIWQYLEAAAGAGQQVNVITLTGTPGDSSISTVRHLMRWTHGAEHAPLPMDKTEYWIWKQITDETPAFDSNTKKARRRPPPGKLRTWFTSPDDISVSDDDDRVRHAVGSRIEQTPGCFYYRIDEVAAQLEMSAVRFGGHSKMLVEEFRAARRGDELTDGRVLDVPVLDSVLFQTLGLGFARIIDPPPPSVWRDARKEYNSLVREVLSNEAYGLHTPSQVGARFASGELEDPGAWAEWREIQPTFEVHRKTVWLDERALEFVAGFAERSEPMIIWVAFPDFGAKLARRTGLPFFHRKGLTRDGASIESYKPGTHGPKTIIASIQANATGRNLQDRWHRNLIVGCPAKADLLQQLIGRTHRRGQTAETVQVKVLLASVENVLSLYRARERATIDRSIGRALQSRLLDCAWSVGGIDEYVIPGNPVWSSMRARLADGEWDDE